ncbi:MAG TPA: heavy metal-responsive transcriptional regulator [Candidatus Nanopelagicaceae bacterium]|nr:heavy metal-responsive transcriptional regulator [Candidatus Nanopelagicaceae bacterium]
MGMTVGTAAKTAGVSAKAVRLWESKGLLPAAERTEAGYRIFTDNDLGVLRFVRQAKALGFTLSEIKDVLDLQRHGAKPCVQVIQLLDTHIAQIDRTLTDLRQLRRSLTGARRSARESQRDGEDAVVCRIIETTPPTT